MATIGNLELRIGKDVLCGSSTHDGYEVYKTIGLLAGFLDNTPDPSFDQYKDWFKATARGLLPFRHSEELTGGVPCEVIIDASRKLVLYNADDDERAEYVKVGSIKKLIKDHKYQVLRYEKWFDLESE